MDQEHYVDIQRKINSLHTNGTIELLEEDATKWARWFCQYIKKRNYRANSILDAGCRTGYCLEVFAEEFPSADVMGVDIVPEFVEIASRREEAVVGDIQNLQFEDDQFDWLFSTSTIEHAQDPYAAAAEFKRVTRMGVYICTDLEHPDNFAANPSHFVHHLDPLEWCKYFTCDDWKLANLHIPDHRQLHMLWLHNDMFYMIGVKDA